MIFSIFPGSRRRRLYNWDKKLRFADNDTKSIALKYYPDGNRIWKDSSETGKRKYIVDITGELPVILMELNNSGGIVKTYIYANSEIIAQHDGDVKNRYTYNPFGELFAAETTENVSNPFKFTGQWFDDEIEEYYLRARQYNPHIARFTSRDPVFGKSYQPLTLNRYLYCLNDPINRIDPNGRMSNAELLFTQSIEGALMGALGGGIEGLLSELWGWSEGGEFSWRDVRGKMAWGAIWGAASGFGQAYYMGTAVRNIPKEAAAWNLAVGIAQGLWSDIVDSRKGGGGLNKLDAAIGLHNLAIDAMAESVAEGW